MDPSRTGLTTESELYAMKKELEEASSPKNMAKEKRIFALLLLIKIILYIAAVLLAVFLLLLASVKPSGSSPFFFGLGFSSLNNDRMSPSYSSGNLVFVRKPASPSSIKEGVIVLYTNDAGVRSAAQITHVVELIGGGAEYNARFENQLSFPDPVNLSYDKIDSIIIFKIPYIKLSL